MLDDFLPDELVRDILQHFPKGERASDGVFNIGYGGEHKRQVMPEDCDRFSRELFLFFNSRPVLQFLEGLTGIEGLEFVHLSGADVVRHKIVADIVAAYERNELASHTSEPPAVPGDSAVR